MVELGDWIMFWYDVGVLFWGKLLLVFWFSVGGQFLFGVNEFVSCLLYWLLGVLVLWLVWDWQVCEDCWQVWIVCVLLGSLVLFFVVFGVVMIDMVLVLVLVLVMCGFWLGLYGVEGIWCCEGWLMFFGFGFGLLVKGLLMLIFVGLLIGLWVLLEWCWCVFWWGLLWICGSLLMFLVVVFWYLLVELKMLGFFEYFLFGEYWQCFVIVGWDGDCYGNVYVYFYGSVWLFLLVVVFFWSFWLLLLFWLGWCQCGEVVDGVVLCRCYWLFWGLVLCLFFIFVGNVFWIYVLFGLLVLVLFVVDLLCVLLVCSVWLWCGGLVCLVLILLLFVLFFGFLLLGLCVEQKFIVVLLVSDVGWCEWLLVFWLKWLYLVVFYSGGWV